MDMHYQYAVKLNTRGYIAKVEDGDGYTTTWEADKAHTAWSRSGAARLYDDYISKSWNVTMGDRPGFEIVKVHRPQRIHHPW